MYCPLNLYLAYRFLSNHLISYKLILIYMIQRTTAIALQIIYLREKNKCVRIHSYL